MIDVGCCSRNPAPWSMAKDARPMHGDGQESCGPSACFICKRFGDEGFPSAQGEIGSRKWELGFGISKELECH